MGTDAGGWAEARSASVVVPGQRARSRRGHEDRPRGGEADARSRSPVVRGYVHVTHRRLHAKAELPRVSLRRGVMLERSRDIFIYLFLGGGGYDFSGGLPGPMV